MMLGYTPDQVAALPPPLVKIRELEQENARLHAEIEDMRRVVTEDPQARNRISTDFGRRTTFNDGRDCGDRDYKKRKVENIYMVSHIIERTDFLHAPFSLLMLSDILLRFRTGTINTMAAILIRVRLHHLQYRSPWTINMAVIRHRLSMDLLRLFSICLLLKLLIKYRTPPLGQVRHQAPHSRRVFFPSLVTSSPRNFARALWILVTIHHLFTHQQPAAMQSSSHSPIHHRPAAMSAHHSLSSYHQSSNNYGSVKVEDSHYNVSSCWYYGYVTLISSLPGIPPQPQPQPHAPV